MTAPVVLRVYGSPQPQGNKSAFVRGGRAVVVEGKGPGRQAHAAWRQAVATAARDWQTEHGGVPLLDEPVSLTALFILPRPKSAPRRRLWPDTRPDEDKLRRAVLDALTGVVLQNDSRVVCGQTAKVYGDPPGCVIEVRPATDEDLAWWASWQADMFRVSAWQQLHGEAM